MQQVKTFPVESGPSFDNIGGGGGVVSDKVKAASRVFSAVAGSQPHDQYGPSAGGDGGKGPSISEVVGSSLKEDFLPTDPRSFQACK